MPWLPILFALAAAPAGAPPSLLEAALDDLPRGLREAAPAGAAEFTGAEGAYRVRTGEMDGAGAPEVLLVVEPAGRPAEVRFLAERAGEDPKRERVKLAGKTASVAVAFVEFAPGRSLAHVDGGEAGQALLAWDGERLSTVWKTGRPRPDETRFFELGDLDGDGVQEVTTYVRRDVDVFVDDDLAGQEGGADSRSALDQVDADAVYRLEDGRWRKSRDLLEGLR